MNSKEIRISEIKDPADIPIVRELFQEYRDYLGIDLDFQEFSKELEELPGPYSPPAGCLLLAKVNGEPAGCVALKRFQGGICEMKRLFVRPSFRGMGLGRKLAEEVIQRAAGIGYEMMYLDTLMSLSEAMKLYRRLGFSERESYYENPLADVVYWELDLKGWKSCE